MQCTSCASLEAVIRRQKARIGSLELKLENAEKHLERAQEWRVRVWEEVSLRAGLEELLVAAGIRVDVEGMLRMIRAKAAGIHEETTQDESSVEYHASLSTVIAKAAAQRAQARQEPVQTLSLLGRPAPPVPPRTSDGTSQRIIDAVVVLEKWWREIRVSRGYAASAQRQRVLTELMETEAVYIGKLRSLLDDYRAPLLAQGIISDAEGRELFSQVEVIALYNQTFLAELQHRCTLQAHLPPPQRVVGDVFTNFADFLRSYVLYVNNYNAALVLLDRLHERSRPFRDFVASAKADGKEELSSLLIRPIQRIPRYVLLLSEIVRATPEDHADIHATRQALAKMRSIADELNESKRASEQFAEVIELYNRLEPKTVPQLSHLVAPHRRCVRQGELSLRAAMSPGSAARMVHVALLSDALVVSKPSSSSKRTLTLDIFVHLENVTGVVVLPPVDGEADLYAFLIDSAVRGKSIILGASTEEERQEWVVALRRTVQRLRKSWSSLEISDDAFAIRGVSTPRIAAQESSRDLLHTSSRSTSLNASARTSLGSGSED